VKRKLKKKKIFFFFGKRFRQDELDLYVAMENESRRLMTEYIQQNQLSENYAHVLVILTRLRQLCDHKQLSNTGIPLPLFFKRNI